MNENRTKFLSMNRNCQDIMRLTPRWLRRHATSHDYGSLCTIYPRWSAITLKSLIVGCRKTSEWPVWPPAIKSKVQRTTIARPLHDVARSSHNIVELRAMSLIYIVMWRCATSCDLVRPSKIILRYPTMLGIAARFLNITKTPRTSRDDPWWLQRRTITHDSPRWSTITEICPS